MSNNTQPPKKRGRPKMTEEEKRLASEHRKQNPTLPSLQPMNTEPGDNTRYLRLALAVRDMPPIDTRDPQQVRSRISEYFTLCAEFDMKPTVKGFLNALKLAKQTVWEWKQGNYRADTHQAVILEAYDLLEELWENYMQNGKINPVAGIFLGKNNFGYADKQEYVLTPNTGIDSVDAATVEQKYAELPDCE
mgnify:CR=1 FL=1